MARKILIGFTDRARNGLFSGAGWNPDLPLNNLRDPRPQFIAEATSPTAAAFDVDFGGNVQIDVFALINLRVNNTGTVQVRAGTDPTFAATLYNSGVVSAWPRDNQNALYTLDEFVALGRPRWLVIPAPISCRYARVNIAVPSGTVDIQLGCFIAALAREPSRNFMPGWQGTLLDESFIERVAHGSSYVNKRGMRRRLNLGFPATPYAEAFEGVGGANLHQFAATHGGWLPTVVVPFPDDDGNLSRTAIYGLLRPDNTIRNSMFGRYEYLMQIEQLI